MDQTIGNRLDQQQHDVNMSYYGTLAYERGFEIVEIDGWIRQENGDWVVVYGNPDLPAEAQRRTAVLKSRVVDVDLLPTT